MKAEFSCPAVADLGRVSPPRDGGDETWVVRGRGTVVAPEPASLSLVACGLLALAGIASRRKNRKN